MRLAHTILQIEYVLDLALETFGPDVRRRRGVDELPGDADPRPRPAHAAFQHVTHAKLAADLLHVDGAALVGEGRVARDDEYVPVAGQAGDDVLHHAVGEIVLIGIRAHVLERQDRDRRHVGSGAGAGRGGGGPWSGWCLRPVECEAVDADRPRDVLELLLALIDEADIEPAFGILLHAGRHADAARLGQALEAGGHVHAIAEDVVILDDDVADMHADAELDAPVLGHVGIAGDHPALHVDSAADGIDDAAELGQQPVARRLDQPSVMLGELGIEQKSAMGLQLPDRAFLVGADQPAVACDIGRQDGRQPPIQTLAYQGCLRGYAG